MKFKKNAFMGAAVSAFAIVFTIAFFVASASETVPETVPEQETELMSSEEFAEQESEVSVIEDKAETAETDVLAAKVDPYYAEDYFIVPVKEDDIINFNYENASLGVNIEVLSEETEIFAVADGEVVLSQYDNNAFGHTIMIRHNNGLTTLYAHCSKLLVNEGDYVEQGQTIAIVGNTGRHLYPLFTSHPYLYFSILLLNPGEEISYESRAFINPKDYFSNY